MVVGKAQSLPFQQYTLCKKPSTVSQSDKKKIPDSTHNYTFSPLPIHLLFKTKLLWVTPAFREVGVVGHKPKERQRRTSYHSHWFSLSLFTCPCTPWLYPADTICNLLRFQGEKHHLTSGISGKSLEKKIPRKPEGFIVNQKPCCIQL